MFNPLVLPLTSIVLLSLFLCMEVKGRQAVPAQQQVPLQLPDPALDTTQSLMQALQDRKSSRTFSPEDVPLQILSNLLWAALGINRPEAGKRTAPSAVNWQEIDIYVASANGLYVYDAQAHVLQPVLAEDIRASTGLQEYVQNAPINLVYVADYSKMSGTNRQFYAAADTGFISQNVYLYCASEGLATVVRGLINRPVLARKMKLRPSQHITLAQSIGYP